MITREADYAIRMVLYLSTRGEHEGPASSAMVSAEMEIPYRFLRKIVRRMVASELLCSRRGKGGGLALAKPADAISLLDVLNAIDPHGVKMNSCLREGEGCTRLPGCPIRRAMLGLQEDLEEKLAHISFAQLRDGG